MSAPNNDAETRPGSVHGHVIPRRRFTRWALYYFLLYCCLPLCLLALLTELLLYTVFRELFGGCYALICLLG